MVYTSAFLSIDYRRFFLSLTLKGDNDLSCMASTPSTLISMFVEINSLPGTKRKTAIANLVGQEKIKMRDGSTRAISVPKEQKFACPRLTGMLILGPIKDD